MHVIFVAWGEDPWFDPALRCALAFAGCPVIVVSDRRENKAGCTWIDIREFGEDLDLAKRIASVHHRADTALFEGQCSARWSIIGKLVGCDTLTLPAFCLDRDELVFTDLKAAALPFKDNDYASTYDGPICRAPILVNRLDPVLSFCDYTKSMLDRKSPRVKFQNDMRAWEANGIAYGWSVGNLSLPVNSSVFDNSLGCEQGCVQKDGGKMIVWRDYRPHFVSNSGELWRANTVHCWGPFKKYMAEYAGRAGL